MDRSRNGVAHSGSFDPSTDIAGNYTYSIGALAPCVADQSIVTVTHHQFAGCGDRWRGNSVRSRRSDRALR
ncbi:MAG: hypothetical protein IPI41_05205 [Flavobacteriales bacterium]|nr:hypothetical protein [Flavobacteriales bacterium]